MKTQNIIVAVISALAVCTQQSNAQSLGERTTPVQAPDAQYSSTLFNPGPSFDAGSEETTNNSENCGALDISSMTEAYRVPNPKIAPKIYCQGKLTNAGGYAPSYYHVVASFDDSQRHANPGWDIAPTGGNGSPITFVITNNSANIVNSGTPDTDPCEVHEVSVSYVEPNRNLTYFPDFTNTIAPGMPNTVFKRVYDINEFSSIVGKFSAKLNSVSAKSGCASYPTRIVELDFIYENYDVNGNLLYTYIIGVNVFNPDNTNNAEVFYKGCDSKDHVCATLLNGSALGYPVLSDKMQDYSIDFKPLIAQYMQKPPVGTAYTKIIGYESYSSCRNADITYTVSNIDLLVAQKQTRRMVSVQSY